MARKIKPEWSPHYKFLLYGYPGSTKTRTLGTAAMDDRTAPVLWLDAGGNPVSIRNYDPLPTIIRVEELEDLNDPYDWIAAGQPKDHPLAKQFGLEPGYKTIVVDQITEVQRLYFDKVLVHSEGRLKPGSIAPKREWKHYNAILYSMINFARLYYGLADLPPGRGVHVMMTAQERAMGTDLSGKMTRPIGPDMEGDSFVEIPSYAELVGRLLPYERVEARIKRKLDEGVDSMLILKAGEDYLAKDQYNGNVPYITNPTITKLLDKIEGVSNG